MILIKVKTKKRGEILLNIDHILIIEREDTLGGNVCTAITMTDGLTTAYVVNETIEEILQKIHEAKIREARLFNKRQKIETPRDLHFNDMQKALLEIIVAGDNDAQNTQPEKI